MGKINYVVPSKNHGSTNPYYDVHYKDINGKQSRTSFSTAIYGKYAKNMAEFTLKNGYRLENWFEEKDDYIIIYVYAKSSNEYREILLDKDDYNKLKKYHWKTTMSTKSNVYYAIMKPKGSNINDKNIKMHRLIMNVTDTKIIIDHINGNGLDNRKCNLRITNAKGNSQNRPNINSNNTSGINGVYRETNSKGFSRWRAQWHDDENKLKCKSFSCEKYGEEKAKQMAIDYRQKMVDKFYIK